MPGGLLTSCLDSEHLAGRHIRSLSTRQVSLLLHVLPARPLHICDDTS